MNDTDGILAEYVPLRIKDIESIYATEDNDEFHDLLERGNFDWCIEAQRNETMNQIFDGTPHIFSGEAKGNKALATALEGKPLRLPLISYCYGSESIMFHNSLIQDFDFSPILGVITTPTIIRDATLSLRMGYSALSFHKSLSAQRINSRLANLPISQRPILKMSLYNNTSSALLIHKSIFERWQELEIQDVEYTFDNNYGYDDGNNDILSLPTLLKKEHYYGGGEAVYFESIQEYQQAKNGNAEMLALVKEHDNDDQNLMEKIDTNPINNGIPEDINEYFEELGSYDDPYFILLESTDKSDEIIDLFIEDGNDEDDIFQLDDNRILFMTSSNPKSIKVLLNALTTLLSENNIIISAAVFHHNCIGSAWETFAWSQQLLAEVVSNNIGESIVEYNDFCDSKNWPGLEKYRSS